MTTRVTTLGTGVATVELPIVPTTGNQIGVRKYFHSAHCGGSHSARNATPAVPTTEDPIVPTADTRMTLP